MPRLVDKILVIQEDIPDGVDRIEPSCEDLFEGVAQSAHTYGGYLLTPEEMPAGVGLGFAAWDLMMHGYGVGPRAYMKNAELARTHLTLNTTQADVARLQADMLDRVGRAEAAKMLRGIERHLGGEAVDLDALPSDVSPNLDFSLMAPIGAYLKTIVAFEEVSRDAYNARIKRAVDSIPWDEYARRAQVPKYPGFAIGSRQKGLLPLGLRFYTAQDTYSRTVKNGLPARSKASNHVTAEPVVSVSILQTSIGELHDVCIATITCFAWPMGKSCRRAASTIRNRMRGRGQMRRHGGWN